MIIFFGFQEVCSGILEKQSTLHPFKPESGASWWLGVCIVRVGNGYCKYGAF